MEHNPNEFRAYFTITGTWSGGVLGGLLGASKNIFETNPTLGVVLVIGGAALGGVVGYFGTRPFNRLFH